MVDIDENELNKKTFIPDLKIKADVGEFINVLLSSNLHRLSIDDWLLYCNKIKKIIQ